MNKIYCYIRKSTDKQSYERQFNVLKERGYINNNNCEYIEETYTGKTLKRPILDELLSKINKNDTIVVESLSRLSRGGLVKTLDIVRDLVENKNINVIILKENFNLRCGEKMDASTKMLLGIFAILAEFERDLISERTSEGLQAVKSRGVKLGRPTDNDISVENFIKTLKYQVDYGYTVDLSLDITKYPKSTFILNLKKYREMYNLQKSDKCYKIKLINILKGNDLNDTI